MDRPDSDPEIPSPSNRSNCCFNFPCFGSRRSNSAESAALWERIRTAEINPRDDDRRWWVRATMKVREWSEITAGPKWKNFIRRFNRNKRSGGGGNFQYDPLSYALNFDGDDEDDDIGFGGLRSFSSRYAGFGKPFGGRDTAEDGVGKSTAAVSS